MAEQDWWTAPAEGDNGSLIMVTGRRDAEKFRSNPRFNIRFEIEWRYGEAGMPDEKTAETMGQVQDLISEALAKDPVAVLTGIYTGDGIRNWVFYTLSTHILARKINEALASLPLLPLKLSAENDPDWAEYDEMSQLALN